MKNTKKQGQYILFVYQEKPKYYIGVCLEFDIIEEGETLQEALENIKEASQFYLETVIKKNWPDKLLNQPAPKEYWEKYANCLRKEVEKIKKGVEALKKNMEEKRKLAYWNMVVQKILYPKEGIKEKTHA